VQDASVKRSSDPIPDRLRGAGLVMNLLTIPVAAMPIGMLFGATFERGIGLTTAGQTVVVFPSMLPWLVPLAIATFVVGLFVYFGRLLREGFVVALGWTIALAVIAPPLAAVFGLVAYSIWTGRRRLDTRAAQTSPSTQ
jgi:fumarate reductase subunit D